MIRAEQTCADQPDHCLFLRASAEMGVTKEEVRYVAMGEFAHLKVSHELGIGPSGSTGGRSA